MKDNNTVSDTPPSLDPQNWDDLRELGHQMLDDMFAYMQNIDDTSVWQLIPDDIQNHFKSDIPENPQDAVEVYQEFTEKVQPYMLGNITSARKRRCYCV